jgi:hypothetical protein
VLTLVVTAHGDLDRALKVWDGTDDPAAAVHMAVLRSDVIYQTSRTYLHSAYLEDYCDAADRIGAFLTRPEITPRIETSFFKVEDPRLQQLLSDATYLS